MKVPFTIGTVGHFGLAVRDPRRSAQWFIRVLGLRKEFEFEEGVAVGNDNVTIKVPPRRKRLVICHFICRQWPSCERRSPTSRGTRSK
jgi:hypothetical protein